MGQEFGAAVKIALWETALWEARVVDTGKSLGLEPPTQCRKVKRNPGETKQEDSSLKLEDECNYRSI